MGTPTVAKPSVTARPARRKPESLARIKKAAHKLFVERGYHATRPQDIAREAGLGHGTFYLHYEDKRACFRAFVEEARADLGDTLTKQKGENIRPHGVLEPGDAHLMDPPSTPLPKVDRDQ